MKTRMVYTRFWHDNYISELKPEEKLVFVYLITNEKVNICGIYELPDRYIKFDLGLKQNELVKIKRKFMENGKFLFIDGWVKILNYERYNRFLGEKNEKAKENELSLIPIKIREFTYPIDRVSTNGDTLNSHSHNTNTNKLVINKDKYLDAVFLTKEEYNKLVEELGEPLAKEMIKDLSLYIQSKGKKYKSHYATILTWHRKDLKEGKNRLPGNKTIKQLAQEDKFDWEDKDEQE